MDNNMEDTRTQHVQCWTCNHVLDFASYYIITLIWTYYHANHDHILWNPLWCMLHQCSSKFSSSWGIITGNFFLLHISANTHGLPDVRCFLLNQEVRSWTIRFCEFFRGTELCPHICRNIEKHFLENAEIVFFGKPLSYSVFFFVLNTSVTPMDVTNTPTTD